jgi:1-acyl-sn-glycerol-3-phosphate acyltransferase
MGWKLLDNETYTSLEKLDRSMVIFSHSSFWDFFIFTLYGLSYPNREHVLRTLVTPWPFKYFGNFLRQIGAIESTRVEDTQGGAVDRIIRELQKSEKFVFFISPKGTLRNTPWRSGYYHIAKQLNLPIHIAGLDYERHQPILYSNPPITTQSEPEIRTELQDQLRSIVPLYPEGEVVPIRWHKSRSIINWKRYRKLANRCFIIIRFINMIVARLILFVTGWSGLSHEQWKIFDQHPRAVVVFSHTSYFDFYILALYLMAYPNGFSSVRTLVKPEPFAYAGWLLRRFGAIPATRVDDRNGGSIQKIIQTLEHESRFLFFISPKGSIVNRPWRSGYYHIAQQLRVPLLVAGLDYETHSAYVSTSIDYNEPQEAIEKFLKDKLSQIVPLFPEEEVVPIRQHRPPTVCHKWQLGISVFVLILFLIRWW